MKRVILTIGFATIMACVCAQTMGADKTFYSSGQILPGEVWDHVYIQNDNTIVDMLGGQIGRLTTRDVSTFNMSDGQINIYVDIGPSGTTHISNGIVDISDFFLLDDSYGLFSGGNVTATTLKTYPGSGLEFTGGILNFGMINIMGELNIYGGLLNIEDSWGTRGVVNIYGYDFNYVPIGDPFWGGGTLTGYLMDNNPFVINGLSQDEFEHFNLIPEPATLLLLGIGSLLLNRKSFKKD
jgi:hypothetical protein